TGFQLLQNYPNPFNAETTIAFHLPFPSRVNLEIFNLHGEKIETLLDRKNFTAGAHKINWQAEGLTSGIYFYHLRTNDFVETRKLILLK
ncbi:T9SS type A sorting domain-containing protein, partial [bacterium]|nr:T9SS type A sorting domain-containing protein [bacterium]